MAEIVNIAPGTHKAVGASASAHKAGLYANAARSELHDHNNPLVVGNGQGCWTPRGAGRVRVELESELGLDRAGQPTPCRASSALSR